MKKLKLFTSLTALALPLCMATVPAFAATPNSTLYVSAHANNSTGNGTHAHPYQTIQQAIDKAQTGSTIIVEPGTYEERLTISKRITLESDPHSEAAAKRTIIDATDPSTLEVKDYTVGNGIQIENGASGTKIIGLTVEHASHAGILAIGNLSNLTFQNDHIIDNAVGDHFDTDWEALHLVGVTDSLVENNIVEDNLDGGIYLTDETGPTHGNKVIGNVVKDNAVDCGITLASHGFFPGAGQGVYDNLIKDNLSIGNGAAGVVLATPAGKVYDNIVINNYIAQNDMGGVVLHSHSPASDVHGNQIIGNIISANKPDGEVTGGKSVGISIGGEVNPVKDTTISRNIISNQDVGIYIGLGTGTEIQNNIYPDVTTPVYQQQ
jgi:parallel beta-helix repeat protein